MNEIAALVFGILGVIAGIAALIRQARKRGVAEERARRARMEREAADATRRRMDNATTDMGDDPAVLRDWLRARGRQ